MLNFFPWVALMKRSMYLNSMLYEHIFDSHSLISSLKLYRLDIFVMLTCQLYSFQDLIGLEGANLVDFMATTGNKYGILSYLWCSLFFFYSCICEVFEIPLFTVVGQLCSLTHCLFGLYLGWIDFEWIHVKKIDLFLGVLF